VKLDPLVGLENDRMPLRSKLLSVPALRERYLAHIRTIAEKPLDWEEIGLVIAGYRKLIRADVERDTRKLGSFESFLRMTDDKQVGGDGEARNANLRSFIEQRREYLLQATSGDD
jgi:hypothetical protein